MAVTAKKPKTDTDTEDLSPSALDVLERAMVHYDQKAEAVFARLVQNASEKGNVVEALKLAMMQKECRQHAIDAASKLAPYRHPKLESIDLRSEETRHYVIRAPETVANLTEWMAKTGASMLQVEEQLDKLKPVTKIPPPFIIDDEDDAREYYDYRDNEQQE
jgi:hypothetical protein